MKPKNEPEEIEDEEDIDAMSLEDREKDYSSLKSIEKQLGELYPQIEGGFDDKADQNGVIDECWDIYNCVLNENQVYNGNSRVYLPIARDAMEARETRFINMLFPQSGRYSEVIGNDGEVPYELMALLDYYVRECRLRENVVPALIRTGDVSGQYALYLDWVTHKRMVTSKSKVAEVQTDVGTPVDGSPEYDDMQFEEDIEEKPGVVVLDPRDLLVLPALVDTLEEADAVVVRLRFSKSKIKKWIRDGIFEKKAGEELLEKMGGPTDRSRPDAAKGSANAAGVSVNSKGNKVAVVYQVWTCLKVKGERRLMVAHFGGPQLILGCKRNPYWCDRVPVLTQPVMKVPGTLWGKSQVEPVKDIQYQANDIVNMGFDSAQYALLPIVMTDPEKNPRAGSMVLAMASVWLTDPNSTKFASMPPLWKDAFQMVSACRDQIFQSLGVNPAMIPHGNAGKKPSQAQVAQEQQVALESSADNVALIQEGILGKLLEWFYELDYQYRDRAVTVKKFGQLGLQADMQQVEPFQVRQRYEFKWYGTEGFKAVQQVQQMISWINVLRGLPPQQLNGMKLNLGPALEYISEVTLGPRLAPKILIDQRHQMTVDPEMENDLIAHLFPVQVHEMDDDIAHVKAHFARFQAQLQLGLDPENLIRGHILEHMQALKAKAAAAQGGMPAGGGAPGQPRIGAQAQPPTGAQNPPGAVAPDNMPTAMPRKAAM